MAYDFNALYLRLNCLRIICSTTMAAEVVIRTQPMLNVHAYAKLNFTFDMQRQWMCNETTNVMFCTHICEQPVHGWSASNYVRTQHIRIALEFLFDFSAIISWILSILLCHRHYNNQRRKENQFTLRSISSFDREPNRKNTKQKWAKLHKRACKTTNNAN